MLPEIQKRAVAIATPRLGGGGGGGGAQVVPDVVRGHHAVSTKVRGAHTASVPARVEVFESLASEPELILQPLWFRLDQSMAN